MATRPSHIYASTLSRRDRVWGRPRRRTSARTATVAMLLSATLGVVIQHLA